MEIYDDAREEFKKWALAYKSSTSAIGWVDKKGKLLKKKEWVCHANLNRAPDDDFEWLLNSFQAIPKHNSKEDAELYIHWLVNDSPYKEVFITKDAKDIMENNYVVRVDIPSNMLSSAMIVSRVPTEIYSPEVSRRLLSWARFVKLGCDPTKAFLYTSMFATEEGGLFYSPISSGHWAFFPMQNDLKYIKNFLLGRVVAPEGLYCKNRRYENANNIWGGNYGYEEKKQYDCFKKLEPRKKENKVNLNIFYKDKFSKIIRFVKDEDVISLIEQLDEFFDTHLKEVA